MNLDTYTRKTIDTFVVEYNEGFGWESASTFDSMAEAQAEIESLRSFDEFDEFESGPLLHVVYRVKCKRVKLANIEKAFI